ncbi:hypothetical protein [Jannaschia seohaensis]|uniref:Uncharacterized protein n=1 Tax=Jannaschia seohaensis TaxID=475081 RepID=A0A2Y9C3I3_9RHOB|nr:hypothetical protein [Jannaschia seohaensis]PWJ10921.1 hypothetical protein BCF38_12126 [Jannaschia seohaensis]SSA51522.1 hypothetical protein SAMN05421539_12126 [Jannaschia seohaensis]
MSTPRAPGRVELRSYASRVDIPFEAANGILLEYGQMIHDRFLSMGGFPFDHKMHIASF